VGSVISIALQDARNDGQKPPEAPAWVSASQAKMDAATRRPGSAA
jgi:hypothetical protein